VKIFGRLGLIQEELTIEGKGSFEATEEVTKEVTKKESRR
jgi:hypothetical protein